jgi:hypothetical protein
VAQFFGLTEARSVIRTTLNGRQAVKAAGVAVMMDAAMRERLGAAKQEHR